MSQKLKLFTYSEYHKETCFQKDQLTFQLDAGVTFLIHNKVCQRYEKKIKDPFLIRFYLILIPRL